MDSQYSRLMTYLGVTMCPRNFVPFRHCIETIVQLRDQGKIVRPLPKMVLDGNKVSFLFGTVSKLKAYRKLAKKYPGLVVGENDMSEDTYINCCYQKLYACFGLPWFDVPEVPTLHDVMSDFMLKAGQMGYDESFHVPEVELNDHTLHFKSSSAAGSSWRISDLLDLLYMEYSRGPILLVMGGFNFEFFSNYDGYRNSDLLMMYALYPDCWDNNQMTFTDKLERLVERKPLDSEKRMVFFKKNLTSLKKHNQKMYNNFMIMLRQQEGLTFPEMSRMDEKPKLIKKASLEFKPSETVKPELKTVEPEGKEKSNASSKMGEKDQKEDKESKGEEKNPETKAKNYKPVANFIGLLEISKMKDLDLTDFYSSDSDSETSEHDVGPMDSASVVNGISDKKKENPKKERKEGKDGSRLSKKVLPKPKEPDYFSFESDSSDGSYDMSCEIRDLFLSFPELVIHKNNHEKKPTIKPGIPDDIFSQNDNDPSERVLWDQGYPGMDRFDNEYTGQTEIIKPPYEFPDISGQMLAFVKPEPNAPFFSIPSLNTQSELSDNTVVISKRKRDCRSPDELSEQESEPVTMMYTGVWGDQDVFSDTKDLNYNTGGSSVSTALVVTEEAKKFDVDEDFLFQGFIDDKPPPSFKLNDDYDSNETIKVRRLPEPKRKDVSEKFKNKYSDVKPTLTYERMLELTSGLEMDVLEYSKNIPSHSRSSKSKSKSESSRHSGSNLPLVASKRILLPDINSYISENLERKIRARKKKYQDFSFEQFDNSCYAKSLFKLLKPFNISCPDLFGTGDHEEFIVYWSKLCTEQNLTEFGVLFINYTFCSSCWRLTQSLSYEFFRNLQIHHYTKDYKACIRCKGTTEHIEYNHFIHSELAMFIDTRMHKILMAGEPLGFYISPPGQKLGGLDYVTYDRGQTGHWEIGDGNFAALSLVGGKLPEPFFECTTGRQPSAVIKQLGYWIPEAPTIAAAQARKTAEFLSPGARQKPKNPVFNG